MSTASSLTRTEPSWAERTFSRPWPHILSSIAILLLDLVTGPILLFPFLFILPVSLSAWFYSTRYAYALAVILPIGRFLIARFVDAPAVTPYALANALVRIGVLLFMAYLVGRTARQTRQLKENISGLVTICAWSRTVEYQGEWISFEEYLKRRFNLDASHGLSPAEAQKFTETIQANVEQGAGPNQRTG